MGGIANGIAYHGGFIPYCATFLTFSDYMRGVGAAVGAGRAARHLRLDARLGRARRGRADAPAGRALRRAPGDPEPVVRAAGRRERERRRPGRWRWSARDGPVALALTRQKLPTLPGTDELAREGVRRGGYVLREAAGGTPQLILIGTGSELQLAFAAAETLEGEGIPTRVVSLPCWERFDAQDQAYRDEVLPPAVRKRVSVEIGVSLGWERWVGDEGAIIGLDHFGASAPGRHDLRALRLHRGPRGGRRPKGGPRRAARPDPDASTAATSAASTRRSATETPGVARTDQLGPRPQLGWNPQRKPLR